MVTFTGSVRPLVAPDQPPKYQPVWGVAVRVTLTFA
jgi:hypothetical protein